MNRGRAPTARWPWRLAAACALSLSLHAAPIVVFRAFGRVTSLDLEVRVNTVEIGLESMRTGAPSATPPSPSPSVAPSAEPSARPSSEPSARAERAPRPAQRAQHAAREEPDDDALPSALAPPDLRLREPSLRAPVRRPRVASAEDLSPPRDAGPAAPLPPVSETIPSLSEGAQALAPFVPRGSLVTLVLRTDRIRANPYGRTVQRLLSGIPDWQAVAGGSPLDVVRDLDSMLLAASNPFGSESQAPDWFVIVRAANEDDRMLRNAIEAMAIGANEATSAAARGSSAPTAAPSTVPTAAPTSSAMRVSSRLGAGLGGALADLAAQASATPSANPAENTAPAAIDPSPSAAPGASASASANAGASAARAPSAVAGPSAVAARPSVFRADGAMSTVTLERYGARRTYALLGRGMAAIAMPGQVDALRSAMARRDAALLGSDQSDPRLVALLEADGVRNLIAFNTWRGPFPFPARAAIALYQHENDEAPDGGAELVGRLQYDDAAQAQHAAEMLEYSRGRWHFYLAERASARGGLSGLLGGLGASLLGIDVPTLDRAIDALTIRAEGTQVVVRASLEPTQVRALLSLASLGVNAAPAR